MARLRWAVLAVALLGGCAANARFALAPAAGSSSSGIVVVGAGVLVGLLIIAFAGHDNADGAGSPRAAPELAPDRRVSEQDCTQPIDPAQGNLRCK